MSEVNESDPVICFICSSIIIVYIFLNGTGFSHFLHSYMIALGSCVNKVLHYVVGGDGNREQFLGVKTKKKTFLCYFRKPNEPLQGN